MKSNLQNTVSFILNSLLLSKGNKNVVILQVHRQLRASEKRYISPKEHQRHIAAYHKQ